MKKNFDWLPTLIDWLIDWTDEVSSTIAIRWRQAIQWRHLLVVLWRHLLLATTGNLLRHSWTGWTHLLELSAWSTDHYYTFVIYHKMVASIAYTVTHKQNKETSPKWWLMTSMITLNFRLRLDYVNCNFYLKNINLIALQTRRCGFAFYETEDSPNNYCCPRK